MILAPFRHGTWNLTSCLIYRNFLPIEIRMRLDPVVNFLDRLPIPARSFSGTAIMFSTKKKDWDAAYDRIIKKRERQEKAKDKFGKKIVEVWKGMTVIELAKILNRSLDDVFEIMMNLPDAMPYDTPQSRIEDIKVLDRIVKNAGFRSTRITSPASTVSTVLEEMRKDRDLDLRIRALPDPALLVPRCPIVTVMGHVDHGKTTLLDSLRNTSVVDQEFGGITQHIGAFSVQLPNSKEAVTFLDTPGHAAFAAMRSRGAHITDIVVLVVAAEDSVMEQTKESIRFANEAKVPIIVAINKCDKPEADIPKTKKDLWTQGIALEEFGGEVQSVCISALKRTGLDELIEALVTQAEIMQLKADPTGPVEAVIVESRLDTVRGRLCTAIIQRGTMKRGAVLVAGNCWAKVRGMFDDKGRPVQAALPGIPVEVLGWRELPNAGDLIIECESESRAQQVIAYRNNQDMLRRMNEDEKIIQIRREEHLKTYREQLEKKRILGIRRRLKPKGPQPKETIEDLTPRVSIVIKSDVDGSMEAILDVIDTYQSEKCRLDVIHYGVGPLTEFDLNLAEPFKGIIYGFNVEVPQDIKAKAKEKKIEIRLFNIIYRLVEDLKKELDSKFPITEQEQVVGEASVIQGFVVKDGKKKLLVAGCRCVKGILERKNKFKLIRGDEVIYDGPLTSMRHFKEEKQTISKDQECGLAFDKTDLDFQLGDTIVCYIMKKVKETIHWEPPGF